MSVKERLKIFLAHNGLSQGKFEKLVGLSNGFVNNVGDSIRTENLQKITSVYPELNTAWLISGEGSMLHGTKEFDVAAAIAKMEAVSEVTLSAVAEILAKVSDRSATVVLAELQSLVNRRLAQ